MNQTPIEQAIAELRALRDEIKELTKAVERAGIGNEDLGTSIDMMSVKMDALQGLLFSR